MFLFSFEGALRKLQLLNFNKRNVELETEHYRYEPLTKICIIYIRTAAVPWGGDRRQSAKCISIHFRVPFRNNRAG